MRTARASFFCSFLVLCSHSASVPVEAFGFPDFQPKMLTHLPCSLLRTLRRRSFLMLCSHSASVPVEAFGFPDFQRKMLTVNPFAVLSSAYFGDAVTDHVPRGSVLILGSPIFRKNS